MKLIVIRHGETDLNKENRLQGSEGVNLPLNAAGQTMVEQLSNDLLISPEVIYASPLVRTQETAQILNKRFQVPIVTVPEIRERNFGTLSDKPRCEVDQQIILDDLEGHYDYRPYGGESVEEVTKRVREFVESLKTKKESSVMLVTHRGVIRILYDLYPNNVIGANIVPASKHIFEF